MAKVGDLGPVRRALEETIASDPRLKTKRHAALVALCRVTADQVDQAGAEVSSRLIASYLSALKDIDRALGAKTTGAGGANASGNNGGALGKLQALTGGKAS